ncbi:MAG: trypsin-like serine peptidase [Pyrinomonadaceae bacterium]
MPDLYQQHLERAARALNAGQPFDGSAKSEEVIKGVLGKIKAIVGPTNMPPVEQEAQATEALEALRNGEKPTPQQLGALEFIVRMMRPVPFSRASRLDDLNEDVAPAFPDWSHFQGAAQSFLYSIARIDLAPKTPVGTGFLVAGGLLVTNRHVLDVLSRGTGLLEKGQAVARFKYEYGSGEDEPPIAVLRAVATHPRLDLSLLEIEEPEEGNSRQPVEVDEAAVEVGHPVVAVGYPLDDSKRNPLFLNALFWGVFGVKRAAPGEVAGHGPQTLLHDCSTVGGNSGSPVFSMKTGRVIGIHREGFFLYRNEAVDGASLKEFVNTHAKD